MATALVVAKPPTPRKRARAKPKAVEPAAEETTEAVADDRPKSYCGYCTGYCTVWCPDCGGFAGCLTCKRSCKVPCPACSGGELEKWRP